MKYLTNGSCEDTGVRAPLSIEEYEFLRETDIPAFGGFANFAYSYLYRGSRCFGPEVYFMSCEVGATPTQEQRDSALKLARAALPRLRRAAQRFGGRAVLTVDDEYGDRHIIRCFCPMRTVVRDLTPEQWRAYWSHVLEQPELSAA